MTAAIHKPTLTSRQRVARMMERRDQDRIPRHETFWPETITRWQSEGLVGDANAVLDTLETDFQSICWCWPVAFPGESTVLSEDEQTRTIVDGQGKTVRLWKHRSGTPEHIAFGCETRSAWEKEYKPALLKNPIQVKLDEVVQHFKHARSLDRWAHLTGVEPFEETRSLMGDEITLMAMADAPEWIADVATTFTDVMIQNYEAILSTGVEPDGLWTYADMAYNHATMCSPQMYRELIWPQHKRLCDWAHARKMKFIFHTDGDINGVVPLYIEAGFDCIQPLEAKAGMNVKQLAPRFGSRLSLFGNINVMTMATNDLELIEQELCEKFDVGKRHHCYAYHSDHSVPPSVSWETYQGIISLVKKHGWYED